jgi:hypothetical protein
MEAREPSTGYLTPHQTQQPGYGLDASNGQYNQSKQLTTVINIKLYHFKYFHDFILNFSIKKVTMPYLPRNVLLLNLNTTLPSNTMLLL